MKPTDCEKLKKTVIETFNSRWAVVKVIFLDELSNLGFYLGEN